MEKIKKIITMTIMLTSLVSAANMVEKLDRGLIAIPDNNGMYLSWRVKGYEDPEVAFNLYKNGNLLNPNPLTGATNYFDANGSTADKYAIKKVLQGVEFNNLEDAMHWSEKIHRIPLNRPAGGSTQSGNYSYTPNDASVGDLTGDGKWDIVLKWDPTNSQDNSKGGFTGNVYLDGYTVSGQFLWRIDLGVNIRAGAHYTQFLVADFDLDGKAEIICKTAPGTKDASGNYISKGAASGADHSRDYRNGSGYILSGPEYLTVFGSDGLEKATIDYVPARGSVSSWGDSYGNRVDRFLATTAYLDGEKLSAVFQRGYYTRMVLAAFDWDGTTLSQRWVFDSNNPGSGAAASQGNHNLSVGDVDGDGFDEILQGAAAIDHDGTLMYSTGLGHGDAIHLSDLDPSRPGLELMTPHEEKHTNYPGTEVHDARTGELLWQMNVDNQDVGRGMAADIDDHPGFEIWSSGTDGIYNIDGTKISSTRPSVNFRIYWDGDLRDELVDGIGSAPSPMKIEKWNGSGIDRLVSTDDRYGNYVGINNNSTKANPALVADILGDWREEMILRENTNEALLIYSTTIPSPHRLFTLMHDPVYRVAVSWQNTSYNQPPHLGFYIGDGLDNVSHPDVSAVGADEDLVSYDCAGTIDGVAYVDQCGQCVGGTTGLNECSGYFDLADACNYVGTVDTDHLGFVGKGYLNLENSATSTSMFSINSTGEKTYEFKLRYANGSVTERFIDVEVNGVNQVSQVMFANTQSWAQWSYVTINLSLTTGINEIVFKSIDDNGPANLDIISYNESGLDWANCAERPEEPAGGGAGEPEDEITSTLKSLKVANQKISFRKINENSKVEIVNINGEYQNIEVVDEGRLQSSSLSVGVYIVKIYENNKLIAVDKITVK